MEADFEDVLYYCEISWLSRKKVLERIFKLKDEIQQFLEGKANTVAQARSQEFAKEGGFFRS